MRRRLASLILVLAVLVLARFGLRRQHAVDLALDFGGDAARVRQVSLVISDEHDQVARDLSLRYPTGAPPVDHKAIKLVSGTYTVAGHILVDGAPERHPTRTLLVENDGTYSVDLSP